MLKNISKLLTGDVLKVLCDMGHDDVLILADANFPAEAVSKSTTYGKLIRCSGADTGTFLKAIADIFPLDTDYTEYPACVMDVTREDRESGMSNPEVWGEFTETLCGIYPGLTLGKIERFDFYEKAKKAYAVIQTGEEKQYGNLLLVKGCIV